MSFSKIAIAVSVVIITTFLSACGQRVNSRNGGLGGQPDGGAGSASTYGSQGNAVPGTTSATEGGAGPGGGDLCEDRISVIRDQLSTWLEQGEASKLDFPKEFSAKVYSSRMLAQIKDAKIRCLSEDDPNYFTQFPVSSEICHTSDNVSQPWVTCDFDRFIKYGSDKQIVLINHQFAVLAELEPNTKTGKGLAMSAQMERFSTGSLFANAVINPSGDSTLGKLSKSEPKIEPTNGRLTIDSKCEKRVEIVGDDLKKWIARGGAAKLQLPNGLSKASYSRLMTAQFNSAEVRCVKSGDDGFPVVMSDVPKVCKFDFIQNKGRITCDAEKLLSANESDQYVLIHHEFAGLAHLENPNGDQSTYAISNQISGYSQDQAKIGLGSEVMAEIPKNTPGYDAALKRNGLILKCVGTTRESREIYKGNFLEFTDKKKYLVSPPSSYDPKWSVSEVTCDQGGCAAEMTVVNITRKNGKPVSAELSLNVNDDEPNAPARCK